MRTRFEEKPKPCWACRLGHTKYIKVTEGPYAGYEGEEPKYECKAVWGSVIGNGEPGGMVMLSNLNDRLGMDANEAGWTVSWVMECYEKGILSRADLDGLDMRWGNVEAVSALLKKISTREGIGDLPAEGVMRPSQKIGGEAAKMGIYSLGGAMAKTDGWFLFLDCLGICRFNTIDVPLTLDCVHAVAGRDLKIADGLTIGRRTINVLRLFNFRHGLNPDLEAPSFRYGSTPVDGPAKGKSIQPYFKWMKSFYFELSGWDRATGKPLPQTLAALGLADLFADVPA